MKHRLIKTGLVLLCNNQNIVQVTPKVQGEITFRDFVFRSGVELWFSILYALILDCPTESDKGAYIIVPHLSTILLHGKVIPHSMST